MSLTGKPRWDQSKFDRVLRRYLKVTSRTLTEAINTKAFYVARKAVWFTEKADRVHIKNTLGQIVRVPKISKKSGKVRFSRELQLTASRDYADAPLAGVIINARRGRKKMPGLTGRPMETAIRDMLAARNRSVAYIKSGWVPAIKELSRFVKGATQAAPMDSDARQIGKAKGRGEAAQNVAGSLKIATIINEAWTKRDKKNAFYIFGNRGLQKAFNDETQSMRQYLRDKMKPDADSFNREQR